MKTEPGPNARRRAAYSFISPLTKGRQGDFQSTSRKPVTMKKHGREKHLSGSSAGLCIWLLTRLRMKHVNLSQIITRYVRSFGPRTPRERQISVHRCTTGYPPP